MEIENLKERAIYDVERWGVLEVIAVYGSFVSAVHHQVRKLPVFSRVIAQPYRKRPNLNLLIDESWWALFTQPDDSKCGPPHQDRN